MDYELRTFVRLFGLIEAFLLWLFFHALSSSDPETSTYIYKYSSNAQSLSLSKASYALVTNPYKLHEC
jgi:hypothetical protein